METKEISATTNMNNESSLELAGNFHSGSGENQLVNAEEAETLNSSDQTQEASHGSAGPANMLMGALWCIGGIVVTAWSYSAVQETGGHYIIAWGAVVFGGYQFLKGLFQTIAG